VKSVAVCGECHTPRDAAGNLDRAKWLAGVPNRFDLTPDDDTTGAIAAPNLTPDATGLGAWTDSEIRAAFLGGLARGKPLFPVMPYYAYANMTPDDANAVVAYLRSIPPIANSVPARQKLPVPLDAPVSSIPDSAIPHTTLKPGQPGYQRAERGRYLAASIGMCMDCHSPWQTMADPPLELSALFAGGRAFSSREWSVALPPGSAADAAVPHLVYSYNITPAGIGGWSAQQLAATLKKGGDDQGHPLCRPMPSGPASSFGGLTDDDALDIGSYVTTLAPVAGDDVPQCP
jgi:mono/diheme cytochrome c family protein